MLRAPLLAVLLAALALVAPAAAGAAVQGGEGPLFVFDGNVEVGHEERVEGVYVASGDVRVDGRVDGDVIVLSGDILVAGSVGGDVVTLSGRSRLLRSARVGGDVRYSEQRPIVSPSARVDGHVTDEGWEDSWDVTPFLGGFVVWLVVSISFLMLGGLLLLLSPRAADVLQERSRERVGPTIAIGIAIAISLPVSIVIAAVTIVGIPLALGILLALAPVGVIAYAVSAYLLGRRMVGPPRSRWLALLAGMAVMRALALVPVLGLFVGLAAVVFGLGVIGVAIGAARKPGGEEGPGAGPGEGPGELSEAGTPGS